jgi:hypothetical protein
MTFDLQGMSITASLPATYTPPAVSKLTLRFGDFCRKWAGPSSKVLSPGERLSSCECSRSPQVFFEASARLPGRCEHFSKVLFVPE